MRDNKIWVCVTLAEIIAMLVWLGSPFYGIAGGLGLVLLLVIWDALAGKPRR